MSKEEDLKFRQLKDIALKLLARREHSQKELQNKLEKKGFSAKQIACVLQQASANGWQSDTRFTDAYICSRINAGFGPWRILFELNQKGINSSLAEKFLKKDDNAFWMRQIKRVYDKRFTSLNDNLIIDPKHYRFLKQRGFMHDRIMQFLKGNGNEY